MDWMKAPMSPLLAASLAVLALATPSWADEVRFPLTVDYDVLRVAVRKHLAEEARGELKVWRSADGCGSFVLREVNIEPADGRLKITGPASGGAGFPLFGLCWANVSWAGRAAIVARPEIGPDWQVRLRDLDAQLYDSSWPARRAGGRARRRQGRRRAGSAAGGSGAALARAGPDPGPAQAVGGEAG
ncbi:MAG: hypothetical protein DMD86_07790 [Candidatus Rokuibacteriota bacterium]|nr:MAG: hypothetical protein DMD86_07790 [Candidatus Rokubacteria bacterium]